METKSNQVDLLFHNYKLTDKFKEILENGDFDLDCFIKESGDFCILTEYTGRICYKSGKKGKSNRNSFEYHKHIIESKHYSIYGHINFSIEIDLSNVERDFFHLLFDLLASSPRIYIRKENDNLYLNVSLRHIVEFLSNKREYPNLMLVIIKSVLEKFKDKMSFLTLIFEKEIDFVVQKIEEYNLYNLFNKIKVLDYDYFNWYSFQVYTSRRIANELIRHNTEYCLSQESTRYVDKSKSNLVRYDILENYPEIKKDSELLSRIILSENEGFDNALYSYKEMFSLLKENLPDVSIKKIRGYCADLLPLGIDTIMVISFTEWQLDRIFEQRISEYADPLIYDLAKKIKNEKESIKMNYYF